MDIDVLYNRLYKGIQRFLSFRPRTKVEVEKYISRKINSVHDPNIEVHKVLQDMLAEYSWQIYSDEDFIKWWVEERAFFKPKGTTVIKYELLQRGVSREALDAFFTAYIPDEISQIIRFFERNRIEIHEKYQDKDYMKKLIARLQRKGFSYSDIKNAIDQLIKKK